MSDCRTDALSLDDPEVEAMRKADAESAKTAAYKRFAETRIANEAIDTWEKQREFLIDQIRMKDGTIAILLEMLSQAMQQEGPDEAEPKRRAL
jgi:hypothetical protein